MVVRIFDELLGFKIIKQVNFGGIKSIICQIKTPTNFPAMQYIHGHITYRIHV